MPLTDLSPHGVSGLQAYNAILVDVVSWGPQMTALCLNPLRPLSKIRRWCASWSPGGGNSLQHIVQ